MGASTYTKTLAMATVLGGKRVHLIKFSCTNYGTDGIPITAAIAGMAGIDFVLPFFGGGAGAVANGPVSAWWDSTNKVIQLYKATNAGVDATTNITTAGYVYALVIGS